MPHELVEALKPVANQFRLAQLIRHRCLAFPGRRRLARVSLHRNLSGRCGLAAWTDYQPPHHVGHEAQDHKEKEYLY